MHEEYLMHKCILKLQMGYIEMLKFISALMRTNPMLTFCPFNLTGVVNLPGVKVVQERHHQTLA